MYSVGAKPAGPSRSRRGCSGKCASRPAPGECGMKPNSKLASAIQSTGFVVTAEILPPPAAEGAAIKAAVDVMGNSLAAVSVADNHSGVGHVESRRFVGASGARTGADLPGGHPRPQPHRDPVGPAGRCRTRHQERRLHLGPSPDPHRVLRLGQRLRSRRDPGRLDHQADARQGRAPGRDRHRGHSSPC